MIKKGLKYYLNCLKHYCIPLGILSLFVMFGLSMSIIMITQAFQNLVNQIKASISSASEADWMVVLSKFVTCIADVDWNHPQQALGTIFTSNWLTNTLKVVLVEVFGDPEIINTYQDLIANAIGSIIGAVILVLAMIVVGIVIGFAVLKFAVRKSGVKQPFWKMLLFSLLDAVVIFAVITVTNAIARITPWAAFVFIILMLLSSGFFVLAEAYLIYGVKKIKFKEVANIKNIGFLYLVNLIILLITAAITTLLLLLFNSIIIFGIYVVIPFVEIGICVMGSNAEGYVSSYVLERCPKEPKKKKQIKAEEKISKKGDK